MLQKLQNLFVGKTVKISHTNKKVKTVRGNCVAIHKIPGERNGFDIELKHGSRYEFVPEVITSSSVDGKLRAFAGGRRRIQIV